MIAVPISLKDIMGKLRKFQYTTINGFEADFSLLCRNARTYNTEGSLVYEDSEILRHEFYARLERICQVHGLPVISLPSIHSDAPYSKLGSSIMTVKSPNNQPHQLTYNPQEPTGWTGAPAAVKPSSLSMSLSLPKALFSKK